MKMAAWSCWNAARRADQRFKQNLHAQGRAFIIRVSPNHRNPHDSQYPLMRRAIRSAEAFTLRQEIPAGRRESGRAGQEDRYRPVRQAQRERRRYRVSGARSSPAAADTGCPGQEPSYETFLRF